MSAKEAARVLLYGSLRLVVIFIFIAIQENKINSCTKATFHAPKFLSILIASKSWSDWGTIPSLPSTISSRHSLLNLTSPPPILTSSSSSSSPHLHLPFSPIHPPPPLKWPRVVYQPPLSCSCYHVLPWITTKTTTTSCDCYSSGQRLALTGETEQLLIESGEKKARCLLNWRRGRRFPLQPRRRSGGKRRTMKSSRRRRMRWWRSKRRGAR